MTKRLQQAPSSCSATHAFNGNNLAYDARTLKGDLPATGIEGTLFIDGSGGYCEPGYDMAYPTYPCWAY
jgi:hypothetical protein